MAIMIKEEKYIIDKCDVNKCNEATMFFIADKFQSIASHHADEIGVGFDSVYKLGYFWVVMYENYEVVSRLPKLGEEVIIRTWPKPRNRLEFEREYEMLDVDNNLLVKGISNWCLIDINKRMISKALDVSFIGEYVSFTRYSEKTKRKLNLNDLNFVNYYLYKVTFDDIDRNNHMNNAKYFNVITRINNAKWNKAEIAFIHEARLDDEVKVYYDCKNFKGYVNGNLCFEAIVNWEE